MTLSETFTQNYAVSERHTKAIDLMQQNYMCCGAVRFEEYRTSVWLKSKGLDLIRPIENRTVPDSCCVTMSNGCGVSDHPSNIPYTVRRLMNRGVLVSFVKGGEKIEGFLPFNVDKTENFVILTFKT